MRNPTTGGLVSGRGTNGRYWSSTGSSGNAYKLNFQSTSVGPGITVEAISVGMTISCIVPSGS